ncbi:MAG: LytR C-terminal domain-containing protein [Acidimicrobiales bacterium]
MTSVGRDTTPGTDDARPDVDDQVDPPRPEGPTAAGTSPSDETPPCGDATGADPAAPDDVVTLPEHGTGQRAQRRRRRERREHRVTWLLALLGVGILAALPLVALAGLRTVDELKSEDARKVNNDPEAPGYEAFTTPTPTAIVASVDATGKHLGTTFLAAGASGGGAALLLPQRMVVTVPSVAAPWMEAPASGDNVGVVYDLALDDGGLDGLRVVTEEMLGVVADSVTQVGPAEWEALLEGVAPITVLNRNEVTVGGTTYPVGELELTAAEAAEWVSIPVEAENRLDAIARQEELWRVWFAAVDEAGPEAVPGEVDRGLGAVVRLMAGGDVTYPDFPVYRVRVDDVIEFDSPEPEALNELMVSMVPFAVGTGGERTSMRILDGVDQADVEFEAAERVVPLGVSLQRIGNARTYDYQETIVIYYDPAMEERAEEIRDALGVGTTELRSNPTSEMDVTIVVGADFVAAQGE